MTDAQEWFYEDNGRARGPVTRDQLMELLLHAFVPPETRVWTEGFGEEWRAADKTELLPRRAAPPPLPSMAPRQPVARPADPAMATGLPTGLTSPGPAPSAAVAAGGAAHERKALGAVDPLEPVDGSLAAALRPVNGITQPPRPGHTPGQPWGRVANLGPDAGHGDRQGSGSPAAPKLQAGRQPTSGPVSLLTEDDLADPSSKVAGSAAPSQQYTATSYIPPAATKPLDTFAYLLAFSPLIVAAADVLVFMNGIDPYGENPVANGIGIWFVIGSVIAAVADANRLRAQGHNPSGRALVPFIALTHIGYFIRRNVIVPGSLRFLWIWLSCVLFFGLVEGAMIP